MPHGLFGVGGGTLAPAPACSAIVNVAPISLSASASISTRLILVFMFILFALPGLFRHLATSRPTCLDAPAAAFFIIGSSLRCESFRYYTRTCLVFGKLRGIAR